MSAHCNISVNQLRMHKNEVNRFIDRPSATRNLFLINENLEKMKRLNLIMALSIFAVSSFAQTPSPAAKPATPAEKQKKAAVQTVKKDAKSTQSTASANGKTNMAKAKSQKTGTLKTSSVDAKTKQAKSAGTTGKTQTKKAVAKKAASKSVSHVKKQRKTTGNSKKPNQDSQKTPPSGNH